MTPDPARARRALLAWYDRSRRDLPWRGVDDPYAIWVSETMLQQTRVEAAIPYFVRWMERFPDLARLAASSRDEVLVHWQGLGYYRRARALHDASRLIMTGHEGRLPTTADGWLALPGIGPYTAGAIASIAYGERVPAVDGNVLRVLARLTDNDADITSPRGHQVLRDVAQRLVPATRPGDWNQALMELGATVCTPRAPRCEACPLVRMCRAHRHGRVHELPVRTPKRPPTEVPVHLAWIEHEGRVVLTRAPGTGLLAGLWGLPGGDAAKSLSRHVQDQTGLRVRSGRLLGTTRHRFTHRLWDIGLRRCALRDTGDAHTDGTWMWTPIEALADRPIATAHRKAIALACAPAIGKNI